VAGRVVDNFVEIVGVVACTSRRGYKSLRYHFASPFYATRTRSSELAVAMG
jgi:hypothetical protein